MRIRGRAQTSPWASLAKVNATTFHPGDHMLFRAGDTWTGQLWPKGSGTSGAPITIGGYGSGNKPSFAGAGRVPDTVKLWNQQYWTITGIDASNYAGKFHRGPQGLPRDPHRRRRQPDAVRIHHQRRARARRDRRRQLGQRIDLEQPARDQLQDGVGPGEEHRWDRVQHHRAEHRRPTEQTDDPQRHPHRELVGPEHLVGRHRAQAVLR